MGETNELEPVLVAKELYDRMRALWHSKVADARYRTLEVPVLLQMVNEAFRAYLEREEGKS